MFTCVNIVLILGRDFFFFCLSLSLSLSLFLSLSLSLSISSDAGLSSSNPFVSMASYRNFIKAYHFLCLAIESLEGRFQRNGEFPSSISLIDDFCRNKCLLACNKVIVAGVILWEYWERRKCVCVGSLGTGLAKLVSKHLKTNSTHSISQCLH